MRDENKAGEREAQTGLLFSLRTNLSSTRGHARTRKQSEDQGANRRFVGHSVMLACIRIAESNGKLSRDSKSLRSPRMIGATT